MINIPKPHNAKIRLFHSGVNHVSEYTGTSIGRVSYGTRRVWQVAYTWNTVNRNTAQQLYSALYSLGTGQGQIPLFFYTKDSLREESSTVGLAIDTVGSSYIDLNSPFATTFQLDPFDKLQVGDYCLEIVAVSGDRVSVANMPENLLSKVNNTDVVRNYDFYMIGQNVAEIIEYEMMGRKGNNNFDPGTIEFKEIIV